MIVDLHQLRKLSGRHQRAAIMRWLKDNSVKYMKDADGNPVTTLDAVIRWSGVRITPGEPKSSTYAPVAWKPSKPLRRP